MTASQLRSRLVLPRGWTDSVKSAVLHAVSLAHYTIAQARGKLANNASAHVRRAATIERLRAEVALLREEIRIKDARMACLTPQRRPHYPPTERMSILELKTARGWSLAQTAKAFLVTAATIAEWLRRVDEPGPDALVQTREPVNKFPGFVHDLVRRLRVLCPTLGKKKIAEVLARAGLHLGATTIGRMLKQKPRPESPVAAPRADSQRAVTAKRPNHVWHVDLTTVPIVSGFWTMWLPWSLPQRWPFCWWIVVAVDHFSRRVMGIAAFRKQPSSQAIRAFLGRTIRQAKATPKHIVCDKGPQFWCDGFRDWCRRHDIMPRYGAVGHHGSIALVERLIRTLKSEGTRRLLVPLQQLAFIRELRLFTDWYNSVRPHSALGGRTPDEVYYRLRPANRSPRFEPRPHWPRGAPCASPQTLVKGQPGVRLQLDVTYHASRKHLPIVTLRRAA